jgi:hypothetical protein
VERDVVVPLLELRPVGQLALGQQVGHLEEAGLLGELLDRVAAVAQDPLVAVDVGDRAPAGRGVHERRVVGHQPEVVVAGLDLPEVDRLDGAIGNRKLVGLAGAIVGDGEGIAGGHGKRPSHQGRQAMFERPKDSETRP